METYDMQVAAFGASVVSYWKFQGNGTDEKGGHDAIISGSPETSVPTIVGRDTLAEGAPGDGTCIAWPGTSAAFAEAAHDTAHKTVEGTVVVTFQRDSAGQKSCLVSFDAAGAAGGASIEATTAGAPRAYLRDASNVPIPLTGEDGDVQLNRAYTLIFKWGAGGGLSMALWDDAGALVRRREDPNTDGLSGTSPIRFGAWHTTGLGHHDGPFGRVVWLDRRITDAEEAILARARTISHVSTGLTVPSLAEWLKSDQRNPGTITKYVSNRDRGAGDGSNAANAQELQAALGSATPGQTFLAVCHTAGTIEFWDYPSGITFPNGSSGNYITLQARQGDGVVISAGEAFAGARTPNSGFWTQSGLSAADIDMKVWRSTATFSGGAQSMMGFWVEFGHPHQIVRADPSGGGTSAMGALRAPYTTANSSTPIKDANGNITGCTINSYAGPVVHKDTDGRVYIRFQRPHEDKYSAGAKWSITTWPGHPEAVRNGRFVYPISEDPNDYPIYLFQAATRFYGFNGGGNSWIKIGAGINSMGYRYTVNGSHMWMDRGTHWAWQFIFFSNTGNVRSDMFFNRCRFSDGSKLHLCRAEWKFRGWLEGIRSAAWTMANSDTMDNIYFLNCTIADYHEIATGSNRMNRIRMRNCAIFNILDDGIQANQNMNRFEIGYCYYRGSSYGGSGVGGTEGDATVPGKFFLHHCIVDCRFEHGTDWRAQPHPIYPFLPHSPDGRSPWKIYNNLFIYGPDCEEEQGVCLQHCPSISDNTLTGAENMHEAFNNILLRAFVEGTKRYDPTFTSTGAGDGYSNRLMDRSDCLLGGGNIFVRWSPDFSNELFDYNLYWRPSGMSVDPMFMNYLPGRNQSPNTSYATLAAWKASSQFASSKLAGTFRVAYAPGFDGNSTEIKPTLPAIDNYPADRFKYRPAPTAAVTTAINGSLSGFDWWTTAPSWGGDYFDWNDGERTLRPSPWKGALDPNGTSMTVGVLNP